LVKARSKARGPEEPTDDVDLARLIDAWPLLPEALKAGILAMIDSARK